MTTEATSSAQSWRTRVWQHLGLLITTAIFVFVVLRVLIVSRMSTATALAVFATSGVFQVALGILVSSYSVVLLIVLLLFDGRRRVATRAERSSLVPLLWEAAISVVIIVFVPWFPALVFLVLVVASEYVDRRLDSRSTPDPWNSPLVLIVTLIILSVVMAPSVWLPAEVIDSDESEALVGYVLADGADWTSVLLEGDRYVVRVPSDSVNSRIVCTPREKPLDRTLVEYAIGTATFVSCDAALAAEA